MKKDQIKNIFINFFGQIEMHDFEQWILEKEEIEQRILERQNHMEDVLAMVPEGWKLVPDYKLGAHVKFKGLDYVIFGLGDKPGTFDIRPPRGMSGDQWRNVPPHALEILPQGTQLSHIAHDRKMPTDTEMLDWIERVACKDVDKYGDDSYWVDNFGSNLILEGFRETISKAMRGEE